MYNLFSKNVRWQKKIKSYHNMYTDEQVRIIKTLREDDVKWSTIAKVVQKSEGALMSWWNRNRLLVDLNRSFSCIRGQPKSTFLL
jgi:hypothetical protein